MAKDVGAKKVIVASCAPPLRYVPRLSAAAHDELTPQHRRYSNVYGIDMPSPRELVAHGRTTPEIAKAIGADLVIFQTLPDLIASVQQFNPSLKHFDCSVFSGEYVTGGVDEEYLTRLDNLRNENAKKKIESELPRGITNANGSSSPNVDYGCSGPMNGADETIGLHNTWTATPPNELASRNLIS